jgi:hypothetical protein
MGLIKDHAWQVVRYESTKCHCEEQNPLPMNPPPQHLRPEVRGTRHSVRGSGGLALRPSCHKFGSVTPELGSKIKLSIPNRTNG